MFISVINSIVSYKNLVKPTNRRNLRGVNLFKIFHSHVVVHDEILVSYGDPTKLPTYHMLDHCRPHFFAAQMFSKKSEVYGQLRVNK